MTLRAVAGLRAVRVLRRRRDRSTAASAWSSPGFDIDVIFTPGHSPGHVTYAIADEQALFSGDVLFQGSIGRTDLPGGDHADAAWPRSPALLDALRDETTVHPGPHGAHDARRASARPTRSCATLADRAVSEPKLQAPRGTYDVLPDAGRRARARSRTPRARSSSRAGYGRIETPTFEATELFARGVGESTDIVQKEMYTFEDDGGRSLTLRPEGTAPVVPRLPRARHAQARRSR